MANNDGRQYSWRLINKVLGSGIHQLLTVAQLVERLTVDETVCGTVPADIRRSLVRFRPVRVFESRFDIPFTATVLVVNRRHVQANRPEKRQWGPTKKHAM